jgi:hypothetical protein
MHTLQWKLVKEGRNYGRQKKKIEFAIFNIIGFLEAIVGRLPYNAVRGGRSVNDDRRW